MIGVLGLGLSALAVDRVFLADGSSGPQQARAGASVAHNAAPAATPAAEPARSAANTRTTAGAQTVVEQQAEQPPQQARMASLAQLLQQAAERNQIQHYSVSSDTNADDVTTAGDGLFASAHRWVARNSEPDVNSAQPTARQQPFEQRYRLDAILASDRGNLAILNGQPYRVGSRIENYHITAIHPLQRRIELTHTSDTQQQIVLAFKDDR